MHDRWMATPAIQHKDANVIWSRIYLRCLDRALQQITISLFYTFFYVPIR